jgi:Protein of unknown function (DUF1566)
MRLLIILPLLSALFSPQINAQSCEGVLTATRYKTSANGTALDKKSGLIWMRCALGQVWNGTTCTGLATTMNWETALIAAKVANFVGKTDWRVPNHKELLSLIETQCFAPSINPLAFPGATTDRYWSSTPYLGGQDSAWSIWFTHGFDSASTKISLNAVRLVRNDN